MSLVWFGNFPSILQVMQHISIFVIFTTTFIFANERFYVEDIHHNNDE